MSRNKLLTLNIYLEHGSGDTTLEVSSAEVVDFPGQVVLAAHGIDDFVQTGQNGVGLTQEVAVLHQIGHGHIGEEGELLLVFGMGLEESEKTKGELKNIILNLRC